MHRTPNNAQNTQHKLGVAFSYHVRNELEKIHCNALNPGHLLYSLHPYPLHHRGLAAKSNNFLKYTCSYAVSHYNIWNLTVFSSVLNSNHCRSVLNSLLCSLHNWRSVVLVSSAILASFSFPSRSIMEIMRCVKFIRCPMWIHSMLSNANPLRWRVFFKLSADQLLVVFF